MTLDDYQKLKRELDDLQKQIDRDTWQLEQIRESLRWDHGCKTLKDAERLLGKLEKRTGDKETELEQQTSDWRKKWEDLLND